VVLASRVEENYSLTRICSMFLSCLLADVNLSDMTNIINPVSHITHYSILLRTLGKIGIYHGQLGQRWY